jgi:hypothetical protein
MAEHVIDSEIKTVLIRTAAEDTLTTGRAWCKIRNLGANIVSIGLATGVATGVATAGAQTILTPVATTGQTQEMILRPRKTYYLRAVTGDTLVSVEEIPLPDDALRQVGVTI